MNTLLSPSEFSAEIVSAITKVERRRVIDVQPDARVVTAEYDKAFVASREWSCGQQPDIEELMRSAYMHGYAAALLEAQKPHE